MRLALRLVLAGLSLGLAAGGANAAPATHGYTTSNVNFRSGPDTGFPSLTVIPYGQPVIILGCLDDRSWCDVSYAGVRGWVHAAYLQPQGGGGYVPLPDPVYAAPVVDFDIDIYWDDHYRNRPWFADRQRWDGPRWHGNNWWRDNPGPGPRPQWSHNGPGWNGNQPGPNPQWRPNGQGNPQGNHPQGNQWSGNPGWNNTPPNGNGQGNWNGNGQGQGNGNWNGQPNQAQAAPSDDGVIYLDPNTGGTHSGNNSWRENPDVHGQQGCVDPGPHGQGCPYPRQ